MSESDSESKGFKVTDRRMFAPDGSVRPEVAAEERVRPKAPPAPPPEPVVPASAAKGEKKGARAVATEPAFLSLVGWLATNALMQLGEVADPAGGQRMENVEGAREFIEILTMLERKTEGNLSAEESRSLDDVLYDLRMRFMTKANLLKT